MIKEISAWAFCKEDISKIENYEEAVKGHKYSVINGIRVRNKEAK